MLLQRRWGGRECHCLTSSWRDWYRTYWKGKSPFNLLSLTFPNFEVISLGRVSLSQESQRIKLYKLQFKSWKLCNFPRINRHFSAVECPVCAQGKTWRRNDINEEQRCRGRNRENARTTQIIIGGETLMYLLCIILRSYYPMSVIYTY